MDFNEEAYTAILDCMEGRDSTVTSSAFIKEEVQNELPSDTDITHRVQQLIMFGELTLINTSQYGRVVLNESVKPRNNTGQATLVDEEAVWKCYIATGYEERHHSGLFETRDAAEEYLSYSLPDDAVFEPVPGLGEVFVTELAGSSGYGKDAAVIRGEKVCRERSLSH